MQIVIDINEEDFKCLENGIFISLGRGICKSLFNRTMNAIINGTPLQEHGKLGDLDKLVKNIVKEYRVNSIHELPQDIKMFYDKFISSAPTILDATFNYKLKNYAFFRKKKI